MLVKRKIVSNLTVIAAQKMTVLIGFVLFVCFVALCPSHQLWSCRLATLFLGKLEQAIPVLHAHTYACN